MAEDDLPEVETGGEELDEYKYLTLDGEWKGENCSIELRLNTEDEKIEEIHVAVEGDIRDRMDVHHNPFPADADSVNIDLTEREN